jgi:hypothetical protein
MLNANAKSYDALIDLMAEWMLEDLAAEACAETKTPPVHEAGGVDSLFTISNGRTDDTRPLQLAQHRDAGRTQ